MIASKNNKIDALLKELQDALSNTYKNENERIDLKASIIQLDILEQVKKLMDDNNITRSQLADELKISKSFVSQLFSGDKLLNLKMIAQFQELFNTKFVPSFKSYKELNSQINFDIDDYISSEDYTKKTHFIFNIKDYQESKAA